MSVPDLYLGPISPLFAMVTRRKPNLRRMGKRIDKRDSGITQRELIVQRTNSQPILLKASEDWLA